MCTRIVSSDDSYELKVQEEDRVGAMETQQFSAYHLLSPTNLVFQCKDGPRPRAPQATLLCNK